MSKEQPDERPATTTPDDDLLRCAACGHAITREAYRIEMAGAHTHSFVNPGGFVYHVGCFAIAGGCEHVGEPSTAFSWFPGWSWQIAICAGCRAHVGWLFRCANEQFHALIVSALR